MDILYKIWIASIKDKIRAAQIKAALSVNEQMILLYWDIVKSIVEKQQEHNWGSKIVEQMAKDLKSSLPDTNGFSRTNLFAMRKFYLFYTGSELVNRVFESMEMPETRIVQQAAELIQKEEKQIVQQVAGQLKTSSILCKIPCGIIM